MVERYPAAAWCPAHPSRVHPSRGVAIEGIADHITSGHGNVDGLAEMWARPAATRGTATCATFGIGQDGRVIQTAALSALVWHAHAASHRLVAIEHCAREPNEPSFPPGDPGLALSEPQILSSIELHQWLADNCGFPLDRLHVLGHSECDPETTHVHCCEGVAGGWPWQRWIDAGSGLG